MRKDFSTFADGVDCEDCKEYEKEIKQLKDKIKQARKGYVKIEEALKFIESQKYVHDKDESNYVEYMVNVKLERVQDKIKKLEREGWL
jgi:hypothetical protein